MIDYSLPTSVLLDGSEYAINSDFRAVLDVLDALVNPELSAAEKALCVLGIFYVDPVPESLFDEALKACFDFIDLGGPEEKRAPSPKLMDWGQDFKYIVAPVSRVVGQDVRALSYLHWWTFVAAYYEIGDCLFAQIVRIRELKIKGKLKDKADKEWYREHRELVDLKVSYTQAEKDLFKEWGV